MHDLVFHFETLLFTNNTLMPKMEVALPITGAGRFISNLVNFVYLIFYYDKNRQSRYKHLY